MRLRRSHAVLIAALCAALGVGCHRRAAADRGTEEAPAPKPSGDVARPIGKSDPPSPTVEEKKPNREPPPAPVDLSPLNNEVAALEMLYQFQITPAQLEQIAKLAPKTARPAPLAKAIQVSTDFRKALEELHAALATQDDEKIGPLSARVEELRTAERPDLEDFEITDAARKEVPTIFASLSARQVASYVSDFASDFPDPRDKLLDALDEVRKLPGREWEDLRDEISGQVGWLVAGLDTEAEEKVAKQAAALLNRSRGLTEEQMKAQRAELEKQIDAITGKVGPSDVIRHFVERTLAELLSNPRLAAAVEARMQ